MYIYIYTKYLYIYHLSFITNHLSYIYILSLNQLSAIVFGSVGLHQRAIPVPGEVLFRQGDDPKDCYVVTRGAEDSAAVKCWMLKPGAIPFVMIHILKCWMIFFCGFSPKFIGKHMVYIVFFDYKTKFVDLRCGASSMMILWESPQVSNIYPDI